MSRASINSRVMLLSGGPVQNMLPLSSPIALCGEHVPDHAFASGTRSVSPRLLPPGGGVGLAR